MWGCLFIDVEKVKLKSPLKQMEVDDSPITLDAIIVEDVTSLGMCLLSSPIVISEDAFITWLPDWMFML